MSVDIWSQVATLLCAYGGEWRWRCRSSDGGVERCGGIQDGRAGGVLQSGVQTSRLVFLPHLLFLVLDSLARKRQARRRHCQKCKGLKACADNGLVEKVRGGRSIGRQPSCG